MLTYAFLHMRHYAYTCIPFIGLNIKITFREENVCIGEVHIKKKPPQNLSSQLQIRSISEHEYSKPIHTDFHRKYTAEMKNGFCTDSGNFWLKALLLKVLFKT